MKQVYLLTTPLNSVWLVVILINCEYYIIFCVLFSEMKNGTKSNNRIITFGPRQVKFPSQNLGLLIDSTNEYQKKDYAALHENFERDGYM